MRRTILTSLVLMTVFSLICGCAAKGPILVNMAYRAPEGLSRGSSSVVVGVSPFQDDRGVPASTLGKKVKPSSGAANDLVVQGTAAGIVTASVKQALQKRGIAVKTIPQWDPSDKGPVEAEGADILIGGSIKTLWAEVASKTVKDTYRVEVKIRAAVGSAADRSVVRYLTLNSSMDREDVKFSPERVGSMLSEALSTAIEQLVNDPQFKKSLD